MFFQSADVFISSGYNGNTLLSVDKATNISINYAIPRQDTNIQGKSRPLDNRYITNYVPIKYSLDYTKNDKEVESSLGILNPTGVTYQFSKSNSLVGYGCRNFQVNLIDKSKNQYDGYLLISNGILQTYHVAVNVGKPATVSIAGEGLNLETIRDLTPLAPPNLPSNLIKPEDTFITGIAFSGFGITGISIQDFSIDIGFVRQPVMKLGYKYPEYKLSNAKATISMNGYIEGLMATTGNHRTNEGLPSTGIYYLTLQPSCSNYPATTYIMKNPYLDTFSLGVSIGSYTVAQLGFSIPLPFTDQECANGSNLIIV